MFAGSGAPGAQLRGRDREPFANSAREFGTSNKRAPEGYQVGAASRQFRFGPKVTPTDKRYMLMLNARASNLFNHTNPLGLNGVLTSPFFGRANTAGPARRIEFGVRLNF